MSDNKTEDAMDDVVEGEIVSDHSAGDPDQKPANKTGIGLGAKLGWGTAIILGTFLGGIFAEPWISERLISYGLKDAPVTAQPTGPDPELAALKTRLETQERLIRDLGATVQSQGSEIEATRTRAEKAETDLALLAAAGPVDGGAMPSADPAMMETLQNEINGLRQMLAERSATSPDPVEVEAMKGRLELARAETGLLKTRLSTLETELAKVNQGALNSSPRGRLAMTLSELHRKAEAGESFSTSLSRAHLDLTLLPALDQQKAGGALEMLEAHMGGVASHQDLVNAFPGLVRTVKIAAADGKAESWMTSLFVTRDRSAADGSVDAILNEAELMLGARHLGGAIASLGKLDENTAAGASDWIAMATARAAVIDASDRLFRLAAGASDQPEQALSPPAIVTPADPVDGQAEGDDT